MEPMLLLCRKVKTFPSFQLQNLSPEAEVNPSPEDVTELLSFMRFLFWRRLPFPKGEKNGLQPTIRRTGNQKFEFVNALLFNAYPVLLPINDLFLRGFLEEVGDVFIQGPEDLDQAVQGDGREVPFDLGDKPLRQIGPLGQLLLGQIAQLSQVPDAFSNLHRFLGTLYKEISLVTCKKV